ncbi:hypothetical protein WJX77_006833 [Trebouxia sp. C0004]
MSVTKLQRVLRICDFGVKPVKYAEALAVQERLAELCKRKEAPDTVLQLQHASVYTLGKRGQAAHFKVPKAILEQQGIDIHNAGRGGETTYHGPGQMVLYPIVNLRRLGLGARAYVETLEECMVGACGHYDIQARGQVPGRTGVWVEDRKIGAVGVKISQGVASHGIAVNISTNLTFYQNIVPCGIEDCEITTVEKEAGACVQVTEFGRLLVQQLQQKLKYDNVISIPPSELFAPGKMALA